MSQLYFANWESLRAHPIPQWYDDAKVGIFIHWGPYSVPAYANPSFQLGEIPTEYDWYTNNPYAEWYANSVRVGKGPTYEHHIKTYGKDFPYERFTDMWKAENWDPQQWASLFKQAGAKYVVLVTKHHDGFCLFHSKYTDFSTTSRGPMRNITGELTQAVRDAQMKMGLYYSGYYNWTFYDEPVFSKANCRSYCPPTYAYADFVYSQCKELIDTYQPSLFWNDIGWPEVGEDALKHLLAHYYNSNEDAVVNDRFSGFYHGYLVKEYQSGKQNRTEKWEMTRGLGLSFGYNQMENESNAIGCTELLDLLAGTVANNGNLLINVGPKADGTIPDWQEKRLRVMGDWLRRNGAAIYDTRICTRKSEDLPACTLNYTRKDGTCYLLLTKTPKEAFSVTVKGLRANPQPLDPAVHTETTCENGVCTIHVGARDTDEPLAFRISGQDDVI